MTRMNISRSHPPKLSSIHPSNLSSFQPFDRWLVVSILGSLVGSVCVAVEAQSLHRSEFSARAIDGAEVTGTLEALGPTWRVVLGGDQKQELADLLSLRRKGEPILAGTPGPQVILANGDRIRAVPREANDETLRIYSELLGEVTIPLERVAALLLDPPADPQIRERISRQLTTQEWKQDRVIFRNGDQFLGSFLGLRPGAGAVLFEAPQGRIEIAKTRVRAVAFSSDLISFPQPEQLYAEALLRDGSVLSLLSATLEGGYVFGQAAFGGQVTFPVEQLLGLDFRNGRVTYLSDLEPSEYHCMPYFRVPYPYERDRTLLGNFLGLRGRLFRKGISMHSRSELTYVLDGHFHRFEAVVGIDDETQGRGNVVFRVLLDGQPAWESGKVSGKGSALPIRIDTTGAQRLTLVVDFADEADVLDHADWAAARLIR